MTVDIRHRHAPKVVVECFDDPIASKHITIKCNCRYIIVNEFTVDAIDITADGHDANDDICTPIVVQIRRCHGVRCHWICACRRQQQLRWCLCQLCSYHSLGVYSIGRTRWLLCTQCENITPPYYCGHDASLHYRFNEEQRGWDEYHTPHGRMLVWLRAFSIVEHEMCAKFAHLFTVYTVHVYYTLYTVCKMYIQFQTQQYIHHPARTLEHKCPQLLLLFYLFGTLGVWAKKASNITH